MNALIVPHGGKLISRFCTTLPKSPIQITVGQSEQIDIYNIATGAYSPLTGYARKDDLESVISRGKLTNDIAWSIPIIFDITQEQLTNIQKVACSTIELIDETGVHIASLVDIETYTFDKELFCKNVFGTTESEHPGVLSIQNKGDILVGGELQVQENWRVPFDDVENEFILSPEETRNLFQEKGFKKIVAFQTRNVPHRGHEYIQKCALENVDALLIHPVIGEKKTGDFHNNVILGSYQILAEKYYNPERVFISCLPWVMRYAGPKEAIMHAIIRQNFGCSHFIVGRDHAGVGSYYGTYDAQKIFDTLSQENLKIEILRYENAAYCPQVRGVVTDKTSPSPSAERIFISGTKFRDMLTQGIRPPEEFIRPEITEYLLGQKNIFID